MPSIPQIVLQRHRRREEARTSPTAQAWRAGLVLILLLSFAAAVTVITLTVAYTSLTRDLPPPEELAALLEPPNGALLQPTQLFDRTGEHLIRTLEDPAASGRRYLSLEDTKSGHLPSWLADATIVTLEPNFWNSPGYSLEGLGQGKHPTIAQRLVSDLLLWDEPANLRRELRERLLAAQITARYGREKVLEWYLNSADYGRFNYGADAAALAYFGKPANELNLAESAVLAAVAQAPGLNPQDSPQAARDRYAEVLQSMHSSGLISEAAYDQALLEELRFKPAQEPTPDIAPSFSNLVLEQLVKRFGTQRAARGGLKVITSLDYDLQLQADCASANQMARINQSQANEVPALDGSACQAARLLPTTSYGTSEGARGVVANLVILDPHTGQVLAMVGDDRAGLDPAHLPGHPPGSLVTPFIYLTAFTRGLSPASLLWDIPGSLPADAGEVNNPDQQFHGPVRLRIALANDYLVPAIQTLARIGAENAWRTARQLGITTLEGNQLEQAYRLPLEGGEVTLLQITQAYGVFANQGLLAGEDADGSQEAEDSSTLHPSTVLQVLDREGHMWVNCLGNDIQCQARSRPVISTQLAYLMTHILSDETARWPSLGHPNPLEIGRPAGAKTGQTIQEKNAWTVGYTPSLVVGVWVGQGQTDDGGRIPVAAASGIWHAIMQYATRDQPADEWEMPAGVSNIEVCDPSGLLPTKNCPAVVSEVFQDGSTPTHPDNLFQSFQIDRESGLLATIFTPPELVEERVFMIVPPEASEWARQAGLPTIPETYDAIEAPEAPTPEVQITSPEMFASVHGQVSITGNAGGDGFETYRLQIGQGLNPTSWVQIGEDVRNPVRAGRLATWDTRKLSGLYALQLLVVRENQKVDSMTIQVRVDNKPPEVSIGYPRDAQRFTIAQDKVITLQASASDDLELSAVEFYLDGRLINTLTAPPFAEPWEARAGEHTLTVKAIDGANNTSVSTVSFEVSR
jgi:membrane carboxypeptidase/penicillin-binding protein